MKPSRVPSVASPLLSVDRLPPHAIEAEQGVLGCILLDPHACLPIAIERLNRPHEVFYDLRHQDLYECLVQMYDEKTLIDPITIQQHFKANELEALGGMPYIAGLMNYVPAASNLEYYLEIVTEKAYCRRFIAACTSAIQDIYESTDPAHERADSLESKILSLFDRT